MSIDLQTISKGLSADGYITDQDCFSSVRYRGMPASLNGCGWVAAYNLRHYLGHKVEWDDVRRELDSMHSLLFPGPTLMRVMREYLARYVPGFVETEGREAATAAASVSRAGLFRYTEGREPHFVCFIRVDGRESHSNLPESSDRNPEKQAGPHSSESLNLYRFFNVTDDLEDGCLTMAQFAEEHLLRGTVIALTVE